jgi:hypothetical protein
MASRNAVCIAGCTGLVTAQSPDINYPIVPLTGDAWLLGRSDHLAARLARDGDPEPIHIEETDATFAIGWKGRYCIEGPALVYVDRDTGRTSAILGYPTHQLKHIGRC